MLAESQIACLGALVNRVIPPDEFPGGWEAGVGDYLFRQFSGDLRNDVDSYALGLDALNGEALAVHGKRFDQLDSEAQDSLLAQIEGGNAQTVWPIDPAAFFRMVVQHSMEGFYSDPGNGGNRDGIAWKMIGFEVNG